MTSNGFFVPGEALRQEGLTLEGREHHELSPVARIKAGQRVRFFDEHRTSSLAEVEDVDKRSTQCAASATLMMWNS